MASAPTRWDGLPLTIHVMNPVSGADGSAQYSKPNLVKTCPEPSNMLSGTLVRDDTDCCLYSTRLANATHRGGRGRSHSRTPVSVFDSDVGVVDCVPVGGGVVVEVVVREWSKLSGL